MISLVDIHVSHDGTKALNGLSLQVREGTLLGIIGPGGGGKSTLCRIVAGLLRPDQGVVMVGGVDFTRATRKEIQDAQRNIGVQFQNDALFEHMNVLDNVCYPLTRLTNLSRNDMEGRAMERIAMVGLTGFEQRFPNRLSGGQRRRVALARACVTDPEILICDDPTAGLDPVTSRRILDMIAGIRYQTNSTVLVVSSDIVGVFSVSSRVALLWGGRVIEEDNTSVFKQSGREEVARFLKDAALPFAGWAWD